MVVSTAWNELLTSERFQKLGKSVFREDIERELWRVVEEDNSYEVRKIISSGMVDVNCESQGRITYFYKAGLRCYRMMVQLSFNRRAEPKWLKFRKSKWWPRPSSGVWLHGRATKMSSKCSWGLL